MYTKSCLLFSTKKTHETCNDLTANIYFPSTLPSDDEITLYFTNFLVICKNKQLSLLNKSSYKKILTDYKISKLINSILLQVMLYL